MRENQRSRGSRGLGEQQQTVGGNDAQHDRRALGGRGFESGLRSRLRRNRERGGGEARREENGAN